MCFAKFFWYFWLPKRGVGTSPCPQNGSSVPQHSGRPFNGDDLKSVGGIYDIHESSFWPTRRINSFQQINPVSFSRLKRQIPTLNHNKGGVDGPRPQ